ncbi:MAG: 4a-hydroxytetrahydrobiopterin dehydratase [Candidatus Colwellbacteria bacterium]|nr:4a-hydroxytetrahydrobiopterin dehydratase [Candidatus Colwellbacteria bacterium]
MNLVNKKCVPCKGGTPPIEYGEAKKLHEQIPSWQLIEEYKIWRLKKTYKFKEFAQAMQFVNKVADIAEREGHHPNINIHDWNRVDLEIYTHKIKGLHENDFILAAKIEQLAL